jgi:hypothetical protein
MAGIEEPYLYLQQVVAANPLIVHLMICIVCVTAALVLDESKTSLVRTMEMYENRA